MLFPALASLTTLLAQLALSDIPPHNASTLFDLGIYGAYPSQKHVTVDYASPRVNIKQWSEECDDGQYVLLTPRGSSVDNPGPMILDNKGSMVWFGKEFGMVTDLKVQRYKGEDFLAFWSGRDDGTHGYGRYYMLNSSYDVVRTIVPAGHLLGDLHEFFLTPAGTALMTIYAKPELADLQSFGRTNPGWIMDSLFQEVDIETGELIFQWKAGDHYNVAETLAPIDSFGYSLDNAFDYFHINSIDKDDHGNYYVSSRYMQTVTCISPTGEVLWKLGGRHSDFIDLSGGAASNFSWQHHVRWHPGDRLTIFDNGAYNWLSTAEYSRGLYLQLDTKAMTIELIQTFSKPGILAHSQGSMQLVPETGNVFIGWGHSAAYTEFASNGTILCDFHYGASALFDLGWAKSYRAIKSKWVGRPRTLPDVVLEVAERAVYVSWNGATEVVAWRLEGAVENGGGFVEMLRVPKQGFETRIDVASVYAGSVLHLERRSELSDDKLLCNADDLACPPVVLLQVAALDKDGKVLGTSSTLDVSTTAATWHKASYTTVDNEDGLDVFALGVLLFVVVGFIILVWQIRAVVWALDVDANHEQSRGLLEHEKV